MEKCVLCHYRHDYRRFQMCCLHFLFMEKFSLFCKIIFLRAAILKVRRMFVSWCNEIIWWVRGGEKCRTTDQRRRTWRYDFPSYYLQKNHSFVVFFRKQMDFANSCLIKKEAFLFHASLICKKTFLLLLFIKWSDGLPELIVVYMPMTKSGQPPPHNWKKMRQHMWYCRSHVSSITHSATIYFIAYVLNGWAMKIKKK